MADEAVFGGDDSLLLSLPDEMLAHVIGQALPRTIVALSLTCLRLRALCEEEEVWRALVSEMEGGNEWVQREANGEKVGEHATDDVVRCAAYGRPCRGDRSESWFDALQGFVRLCLCSPPAASSVSRCGNPLLLLFLFSFRKRFLAGRSSTCRSVGQFRSSRFSPSTTWSARGSLVWLPGLCPFLLPSLQSHRWSGGGDGADDVQRGVRGVRDRHGPVGCRSHRRAGWITDAAKVCACGWLLLGCSCCLCSNLGDTTRRPDRPATEPLPQEVLSTVPFRKGNPLKMVLLVFIFFVAG